ncbi:MAG: serpin family protein [Actinobacteria bacterium]|nr:serpin family protein [Actinomycetota bacterium]
MRKAKLILFLAVLTVVILLANAALFTQCSKEQTGDEQSGEVSAEQSDELAGSVDRNLVSANTGFGFDIFKELILEDKDKNIFISPLSILLALAMTYNGAVGDTNLAMAEALRFKGFDLEELNSGFHDLMVSIRNVDSDIELAIANSIWHKLGFKAKEDFIERNRKYFSSEVNEIDFAAPEAVDTINGWIEEETRGKIDKMLSEIPADAVMYLINAIYFKGNWTYPFDENLTSDDDFYLLDGSTKKVPMMSQEENFGYYDGDNFSAVKLPYGQEKMAMYIILPDEGVSLDSVTSSLDADKWNEIKESFYGSQVSLTMPKYKMEYGIKLLNDALAELGMGIAFGPGADFSGINPDIFISKVLHKAVIEVNEKGSEAAAATVVEMVTSMPMAEEIIEFRVDRPFFFVIADDRTGSILFMGKVVEP